MENYELQINVRFAHCRMLLFGQLYFIKMGERAEVKSLFKERQQLYSLAPGYLEPSIFKYVHSQITGRFVQALRLSQGEFFLHRSQLIHCTKSEDFASLHRYNYFIRLTASLRSTMQLSTMIYPSQSTMDTSVMVQRLRTRDNRSKVKYIASLRNPKYCKKHHFALLRSQKSPHHLGLIERLSSFQFIQLSNHTNVMTKHDLIT